jgi:hypothetical protein
MISRSAKVAASGVFALSLSLGVIVSVFASCAALDHNPQQEFCVERLAHACSISDIRTAEDAIDIAMSGQIVWRALLPVAVSWFGVFFLLSVVASTAVVSLTLWVRWLFFRRPGAGAE